MTEVSVIQGKAGRNPLGANALASPRLGPGAEFVSMPWHIATAMEGRVFVVNFGSESTPLALAKTAFDEDQPQMVIRVPSGVTIVPLSVMVMLEDAAGTDTEIILGSSENDIGNGTSSAATIGPLSMKGGRASGCTPRQLYTANATALTNKKEWDRFTYPFANATTDPVLKYVWSVFNNPGVGVLEGPASLIVWADGTTTAPSGYGIITYAEFDTADLAGA